MKDLSKSLDQPSVMILSTDNPHNMFALLGVDDIFCFSDTPVRGDLGVDISVVKGRFVSLMIQVSSEESFAEPRDFYHFLEDGHVQSVALPGCWPYLRFKEFTNV